MQADLHPATPPGHDQKVASITASAALATLCARALDLIEPSGHRVDRKREFLTAHAQGDCYLCHLPFGIHLDTFPCPHWLVSTVRNIDAVEQVLQIYPLADVLHFMLLYVADQAAAGNPRRLSLSHTRRCGQVGLKVRLAQQQWIFWTSSGQRRPARLILELVRTRQKTLAALNMPLMPNDASLLRALAQLAPAGPAKQNPR